MFDDGAAEAAALLGVGHPDVEGGLRP
jgi:hypothetical protein